MISIKQKNDVGYIGIVNIKVIKGNKIVKTLSHHNEGKPWLFKLLASVMCGNNESSNMPKYFDIGYMDENNEFKTNIAHRIPLTPNVINNFTITANGKDVSNVSYGAVFTAMIPSIQIIENRNVWILRLYPMAESNESFLIAEVNLGSNSGLELNPSEGYSYMVEWVMTFSNAIS